MPPITHLRAVIQKLEEDQLMEQKFIRIFQTYFPEVSRTGTFADETSLYKKKIEEDEFSNSNSNNSSCSECVDNKEGASAKHRQLLRMYR